MAENTPVAVKTPDRRLNRWDPFAFLEEMREDLERRLGNVWPAQRPPLQGPFGAMPWAPRTDVFEKEGNLVVKAELPGLNKEDIQVNVEDGDLIIKGERKTESETKEDSYYRMERSYGSFYRRLPLPAATAPDSVKAEYKDGILEVKVPVPAAPEKQATKVPIS